MRRFRFAIGAGVCRCRSHLGLHTPAFLGLGSGVGGADNAPDPVAAIADAPGLFPGVDPDRSPSEPPAPTSVAWFPKRLRS